MRPEFRDRVVPKTWFEQILLQIEAPSIFQIINKIPIVYKTSMCQGHIEILDGISIGQIRGYFNRAGLSVDVRNIITNISNETTTVDIIITGGYIELFSRDAIYIPQSFPATTYHQICEGNRSCYLHDFNFVEWGIPKSIARKFIII